MYLFAQILPIMQFVREFIINNPLCVCSDEISVIKKDLIEDKDKIKLKQESSQVVLHFCFVLCTE